jgi:hypothetical protein
MSEIRLPTREDHEFLLTMHCYALIALVKGLQTDAVNVLRAVTLDDAPATPQEQAKP